MDMNSGYCCEQSDNPSNSWIDCNPCSELTLQCGLIDYPDTCEDPNGAGKYCQWNGNQCVNKPNSPSFAADSMKCNQSGMYACNLSNYSQKNPSIYPYPIILPPGYIQPPNTLPINPIPSPINPIPPREKTSMKNRSHISPFSIIMTILIIVLIILLIYKFIVLVKKPGKTKTT
jgi:hypothetical protein